MLAKKVFHRLSRRGAGAAGEGRAGAEERFRSAVSAAAALSDPVSCKAAWHYLAGYCKNRELWAAALLATQAEIDSLPDDAPPEAVTPTLRQQALAFERLGHLDALLGVASLLESLDALSDSFVTRRRPSWGNWSPTPTPAAR